MKNLALFLVLSGISSILPLRGEAAPIHGFTSSVAQKERELEARFRTLPDTNILRSTMQRLSARPHHVGSPYDRENAEWILSQFKAWGFEAEIETFDVLFPTPRERVLEMLEPQPFRAQLQEPSVAIDPTSNQQAEQLPSYNAYSSDGDVTASLVYVNYGLPQDYEELDRRGVSVKGAIVIARYGKSWRGVKPKLAAEHGAIGCIIYSDPHEDGYFVADVFPDGPARNENGVQRGSVLDIGGYPGDPLTPGVGAKPDAKRLPLKAAATITRIPVLPISYADAKPLLAALRGPIAPESFRGALPITYHVGPGPAKVHLKLQFNWDTRPVYNVIARLKGSTAPDQWIIRGNHHDAWVNGAADPVSAQISLLEEARALGELARTGWKPKRTIIYCAWDGEEPMLLGSTEWVEEHRTELKQHAAIYINTDANGRGFLSLSGSHALEKMLNEVARDIPDPETGLSVWKRAWASRLVSGSEDPESRKELRSRADLRISALGSGSDYTAFLDHLGIASVSLGFGGEDSDDGVYHSIYDDFYWYTHFADGDFTYARALAQTVGTIVLRFSEADLLPYDFAAVADTVARYARELKSFLEHERQQNAEVNQNLDEGLYAAASDPRHPTTPPARKIVPPFLNFAPLENELSALERSADSYRKIAALLRSRSEISPDTLKAVNARLLQTERLLTEDQGLPRRPWYKHVLYAPGAYTGYGAKTLPGLRESIEQNRFDEAELEIKRLAHCLHEYARQINTAAEELKRAVE